MWTYTEIKCNIKYDIDTIQGMSFGNLEIRNILENPFNCVIYYFLTLGCIIII